VDGQKQLSTPRRLIVLRLASEGNGQRVEASDVVKVPDVGCSNAPSGGYGGCSDEPVVRPYILSGNGELGPDAGMHTRGKQTEGQWGERSQDRLDKRLAAGPVVWRRTVNAMQQLRGGNGRDPDLLVGPELALEPRTHFCHGVRGGKAPDSALQVDEDGGV
jgi:hypothetical protein